MNRTWIAAGLAALLLLTGCSAAADGGGTPDAAETEISAGAQEADADGAETSGREDAAEEEESPSDVVYLSVATSGNWENLVRGNLFEEYTEKLAEWSGGGLVMKIYYDAELGTDLELIAGVQQGTLNIVNLVPSYQISAVPEAALLDVPGLFGSVEEFNYFIDNYYMEDLQEYYRAAGLRVLSCSAFSYRELTANRAISSLADMRGLKLRTMESRYQIAFWQSLGATVIPLSYKEVRLGMQQGILDAQENPLGYMLSENLLDVQDHVILTNHVPMVSMYLVSEEQYEALSEENRELLQRFMDEMSRDLVQQQPAEDEEILERLSEEGVEISEASEDIRNGIEAGRDVVLGLLREDLGAEKVEDFLSQVNEAKAAFAEEQ